MHDDLPLPGPFARLGRLLADEIDQAIRDTIDSVRVKIVPPTTVMPNGILQVQLGGQKRNIPLEEALIDLPLAIRSAVLAAIQSGPKPGNTVSFESLYENGEISTRLFNCMKRSEIETIGEVSRISEEELLKIGYLGVKGISELKRLLKRHGLNIVGE